MNAEVVVLRAIILAISECATSTNATYVASVDGSSATAGMPAADKLAVNFQSCTCTHQLLRLSTIHQHKTCSQITELTTEQPRI